MLWLLKSQLSKNKTKKPLTYTSQRNSRKNVKNTKIGKIFFCLTLSDQYRPWGASLYLMCLPCDWVGASIHKTHSHSGTRSSHPEHTGGTAVDHTGHGPGSPGLWVYSRSSRAAGTWRSRPGILVRYCTLCCLHYIKKSKQIFLEQIRHPCFFILINLNLLLLFPLLISIYIYMSKDIT